MLGFILVSLFALGIASLASGLVRELTKTSSWSAGFGLSGLIGLAAVGSVTYFFGLISKSVEVNFVLVVCSAVALFGTVLRAARM